MKTNERQMRNKIKILEAVAEERQKEIERLQKAIEGLAPTLARVSELKDHLDGAGDTIERLTKQRDELFRSCNELRTKIGDLTKEKSAQEGRIMALVMERDKMQLALARACDLIEVLRK